MAAAATVLPAVPALAVATAVALGLPGWALLGACGLTRSLPAPSALALVPVAGLVAWAPPLAAAMAIGLPHAAAGAAVALASAAMLALRPPAPPRRVDAEVASVVAGALALAAAAARLQPRQLYDEPFHAGRIRRLLDLPELSVGGLATYADGAAHAGYAFPLLHAAQAAAVRLAGAEPLAGLLDLVPVFALAAVPVAYAVGRALAGPAAGAGTAVLAGWEAVVPGAHPHLGLLSRAEQPPAFATLVLVPAALLVALEIARRPGDRVLGAALVCAVAAVALVHPTYAVPALALAAAPLALRRAGGRAWGAAAALTAAIFTWIWWEALRGGEPLRREVDGFAMLAGRPVALAGELLFRGRGWPLVALAGIALLAARRRRREAAVLAGILAASLALTSLPGVVTAVEAVVGPAQTRRFWLAVPWSAATAAVLALLAGGLRGRRLAAAGAALALLAALVAWAGDAPGAAATVLGVAAAAGTLACASWGARTGAIAPPLPGGRDRLVAALLAAALVGGAYAGAPGWLARSLIDGTPAGAPPLPAGLVGALRERDDALPVVLAPVDLAYRLAGVATIYPAAVPESHGRAEPRNLPAARRRDVAAFLAPGAPAADRRRALARWRVDYVVAGRALADELVAGLGLRPVHRGERYVVLAVAAAR